jgi:hypothetical protein
MIVNFIINVLKSGIYIYIHIYINKIVIMIMESMSLLQFWQMKILLRVVFSCDTAHYFLIYSVEHSPAWQVNRFSDSQEIPRILWHLNVQFCVHTCPSSVRILSQLDAVHTPTSYFLKVHLNINLQSTPSFSRWSHSFLHVSPIKPCIHLSSTPLALHDPLILFHSI